MQTTSTFIRVIDAIASVLCRTGYVLGTLMLAFMTALITVDVFGRYLFGVPTYIATEVSGYLMAGMVFLGLGWTSRMGQQIEVTIAIDPLKKKTRDWVKYGTLSLSVAFIAWFCVLTVTPVVQNLQFNTRSITTLRMPMWIPTLMVPLGFGFLALQLFTQWIKQTACILFSGEPSPEEGTALKG